MKVGIQMLQAEDINDARAEPMSSYPLEDSFSPPSPNTVPPSPLYIYPLQTNVFMACRYHDQA